MTSAASRTTELMSKGDWHKILWSTGSQGKYNAIRKHCGCACGHGTFIPVLGPSGQVQLCSGAPDAAGSDTPVDSAGERRRLIEAKLARQRELHEARPTLTRTLTLTLTRGEDSGWSETPEESRLLLLCALTAFHGQWILYRAAALFHARDPGEDSERSATIYP